MQLYYDNAKNIQTYMGSMHLTLCNTLNKICELPMLRSKVSSISNIIGTYIVIDLALWAQSGEEHKLENQNSEKT